MKLSEMVREGSSRQAAEEEKFSFKEAAELLRDLGRRRVGTANVSDLVTTLKQAFKPQEGKPVTILEAKCFMRVLRVVQSSLEGPGPAAK